MRPLSRVAPGRADNVVVPTAPGWWDYTTLDRELLDDAARLTPEDLPGLARDGFTVTICDTAEEFYLAEAPEYIAAWRQATALVRTRRSWCFLPTERILSKAGPTR